MTVRCACSCVAGGVAAAVLIDLVGAWIWLSFIHDGPEFPY